MKKICPQPALAIMLILFLGMALSARSQEGYWQKTVARDTSTNIRELIKNTYKNFNPAQHRFSAKTGDMGLNFEYIYNSSVDRKEHTYRGHVAWEWSNPSTLKPGDKLPVRGVISNLTGESMNVTASVVLGTYSFMKPEPGKLYYAPPNGTTSIKGTADIPKPGIDRNGKLIPYLYLKFNLSGGNDFTWVQRTIEYQWVPKTGITPPVTTTGPGVAGVYNTDFNDMTLYVSGNKVTGTYKWKDGKIEGSLSGNTLTGWWYQSNGKGRFVFNFNSNFSSFTGKWGYNESVPSNPWNGSKIVK